MKIQIKTIEQSAHFHSMDNDGVLTRNSTL